MMNKGGQQKLRDEWKEKDPDGFKKQEDRRSAYQEAKRARRMPAAAATRSGGGTPQEPAAARSGGGGPRPAARAADAARQPDQQPEAVPAPGSPAPVLSAVHRDVRHAGSASLAPVLIARHRDMRHKRLIGSPSLSTLHEAGERADLLKCARAKIRSGAFTAIFLNYVATWTQYYLKELYQVPWLSA